MEKNILKMNKLLLVYCATLTLFGSLGYLFMILFGGIYGVAGTIYAVVVILTGFLGIATIKQNSYFKASIFKYLIAVLSLSALLMSVFSPIYLFDQNIGKFGIYTNLAYHITYTLYLFIGLFMGIRYCASLKEFIANIEEMKNNTLIMRDELPINMIARTVVFNAKREDDITDARLERSSSIF